MPSCIVVDEYFGAPIKLGGDEIKIRAAWFGIPDDPDRRTDVSCNLMEDLKENGTVWLTASTWRFGDPAPLSRKQLVVVYDGVNDCGGSNFTSGMVNSFTKATLVKGVLGGAVVCLYGSVVAPAYFLSVVCSPIGWSICGTSMLVGAGLSWQAGRGMPAELSSSVAENAEVEPTGRLTAPLCSHSSAAQQEQQQQEREMSAFLLSGTLTPITPAFAWAWKASQHQGILGTATQVGPIAPVVVGTATGSMAASEAIAASDAIAAADAMAVSALGDLADAGVAAEFGASEAVEAATTVAEADGMVSTIAEWASTAFLV